jgi:hypothetical protein
MDGRVQMPVIKYLAARFGLKLVSKKTKRKGKVIL